MVVYMNSGDKCRVPSLALVAFDFSGKHTLPPRFKTASVLFCSLVCWSGRRLLALFPTLCRQNSHFGTVPISPLTKLGRSPIWVRRHSLPLLAVSSAQGGDWL